MIGTSTYTSPRREPFDLSLPLPTGRTVIEASAGTGKTYSLTALLVRYVAEGIVSVDQLLVVTFTRAAANELRDRARAMLALTAQALQPGADPHDYPPWMLALGDQTVPDAERAERTRRLLDAVARFDDLTITTIHGFCQQAISQLGLRAAGNPHAVLVENAKDIVAEVCRDVIITHLAEDPVRLSPPASNGALLTPVQVEKYLIAAVTTVLSNPGSELVPTATTTMSGDPAITTMAHRWAQLVSDTCLAVQQRQQVRGQIGYDAIISGLHEALRDSVRGPVVAEQLALRYGVVLVDEFQDTDRVQWDVFKRAFASRVLITVGDPKQAIFRFRGADVHAYLRAADEDMLYSLATNHRSDQQLLSGLEHLLSGATLGDPRIRFIPVTAAEHAPINALGTSAAIHIRAVPKHDTLLTATTKAMSMPKVRQLVLADLAARVADLLDHDTITTPTGAARVQPGDIAVLVPSHVDADSVATALRRSGIPAVRTRTGSVLVTPAVTQWRLLLTALARPFHAPSVRGAALGWFLHTDPVALCGESADTVLADLQERVALMAQRLHRAGLGAFYDEAKSASGLLQTLLGLDEGERHLTDLDHVGELLASAIPTGSEPGQALRVLEEMVAADDDRSEATMRRIDSDALAVQITTIHTAKGLEYPIVLLPFAFKAAHSPGKPYSYTGGGGLRTIDVASLLAWDEGLLDPSDKTTARDQDSRIRRAKTDTEGDDLRLLYVALTRARHRLEVWWASTDTKNSSALARIFLDRDGGGPVFNSQVRFEFNAKGAAKPKAPDYMGLKSAESIAQLHELANSSNGTIDITELPERVARARWIPSDVLAQPPLALASKNGRDAIADHTWRRWSFTRLSGTLDTRGVEAHADGFSVMPALRGGADEPASAGDGVATVAVAHLADAPAGTRFGTFVHTVLEQVNFTAPDLVAELRQLLQRNAVREGLRVDPDELAQGLAAALRTPLGPLFDQLTLADIAPTDRLAELTFDLPIARGLSTVAAVLPARAIAEVLLDTLDPLDQLRPYAVQLSGETTDINIAGWMNGSIDALVRIPRPDGHTYLVIDYKTNRLHVPGAPNPLAAYSPQRLVSAMERHRYPLQALLYSVAVHRYLRWRLGESYGPDQHLGGIGYLFLRGMVGPSAPVTHGVPHGVFSWRAPTATIVALDALLATGSRP